MCYILGINRKVGNFCQFLFFIDKRGSMRKFDKKEFSIRPIIKPMFIISVFLTFLSFYVMRELSVITNFNIFGAKSGNTLNKEMVSDRSFENAGRILFLIFHTVITFFMSLINVLFVLGFVISICALIKVILSLFERLLINVKRCLEKSVHTVRNKFAAYNYNDLYLINSIILN